MEELPNKWVKHVYKFDNQKFYSQEKLARYAKVSLMKLGQALREFDYDAEKAVTKVREERMREEKEYPQLFKYKYKDKLFKSISEVCGYFDFIPHEFKHEYYTNGRKLAEAIEKCLADKEKNELAGIEETDIKDTIDPDIQSIKKSIDYKRLSEVLRETVMKLEEMEVMISKMQSEIHTQKLILNYFSIELGKNTFNVD